MVEGGVGRHQHGMGSAVARRGGGDGGDGQVEVGFGADVGDVVHHPQHFRDVGELLSRVLGR